MPINPYLNATFTKTAMKNHTFFIPVVIHIVGFEDKTAYHIDTYAHVSCDHIVTLVNEILLLKQFLQRPSSGLVRPESKRCPVAN